MVAIHHRGVIPRCRAKSAGSRSSSSNDRPPIAAAVDHPENVARATNAALDLADEKGFTSIAIPGMGTGVGGVEPKEAARHMVRAIRSVSTQSVQNVILVDIDPAMIAAWRSELT